MATNYPNNQKYRLDLGRPLTWKEGDENERFPTQWEASRDYLQGQVVLYDDGFTIAPTAYGALSYFQAAADNTGSTPGLLPTGSSSATPNPNWVRIGAVGNVGTGPAGAQGAQGTVGAQGGIGPQGAQGAGPQGAQGDKGETGDVGAQGAQGQLGPQGPIGPGSTVAGPQGAQGAQGNVGAQGGQGEKGETGAGGTGAEQSRRIGSPYWYGASGSSAFFGYGVNNDYRTAWAIPNTAYNDVIDAATYLPFDEILNERWFTLTGPTSLPINQKIDLKLWYIPGTTGTAGATVVESFSIFSSAAGGLHNGTAVLLDNTTLGLTGGGRYAWETGTTYPNVAGAFGQITAVQSIYGQTGAAGAQGPIGPQGNQGPGGLPGTAGTAGAQGPTGPAAAAVELESFFGSWSSGSTTQDIVSGGSTSLRIDTSTLTSTGITGHTGGVYGDTIEWELGPTARYYIEYNLGLDEVGPDTTMNSVVQYQLNSTGSWTNYPGTKVDWVHGATMTVDDTISASGIYEATGATPDKIRVLVNNTGADIIRFKPNSTSIKIIKLEGAAGPTGAQGAQGSVGAQGPGVGAQGAQGDQGPAGAQGPVGSVGPGGPGGPAGPQGAQGEIGPQGAQGASGVGAQGAQGEAGPQGSIGAQGPGGTGSERNIPISEAVYSDWGDTAGAGAAKYFSIYSVGENGFQPSGTLTNHLFYCEKTVQIENLHYQALFQGGGIPAGAGWEIKLWEIGGTTGGVASVINTFAFTTPQIINQGDALKFPGTARITLNAGRRYAWSYDNYTAASSPGDGWGFVITGSEAGLQGPVGAQGAQGNQGIAGPQGAQGPAGSGGGGGTGSTAYRVTQVLDKSSGELMKRGEWYWGNGATQGWSGPFTLGATDPGLIGSTKVQAFTNYIPMPKCVRPGDVIELCIQGNFTQGEEPWDPKSQLVQVKAMFHAMNCSTMAAWDGKSGWKAVWVTTGDAGSPTAENGTYCHSLKYTLPAEVFEESQWSTDETKSCTNLLGFAYRWDFASEGDASDLQHTYSLRITHIQPFQADIGWNCKA